MQTPLLVILALLLLALVFLVGPTVYNWTIGEWRGRKRDCPRLPWQLRSSYARLAGLTVRVRHAVLRRELERLLLTIDRVYRPPLVDRSFSLNERRDVRADYRKLMLRIINSLQPMVHGKSGATARSYASQPGLPALRREIYYFCHQLEVSVEIHGSLPVSLLEESLHEFDDDWPLWSDLDKLVTVAKLLFPHHSRAATYFSRLYDRLTVAGRQLLRQHDPLSFPVDTEAAVTPPSREEMLETIRDLTDDCVAMLLNAEHWALSGAYDIQEIREQIREGLLPG